MRIVQLMGTSGGGVVRHVAAVAGALTAAGETVVAIGPASTLDDLGRFAPAAPDQRHSVQRRVLSIGDRPHPRDVTTLARLRRRLSGADVVHAHGVRAGALAVLAARSRRRRPAVVVTVHNGAPAARGAALAFGVLELVVARGADQVLVVSADLGERLLRRGARRVERALVPAPPSPGVGAPVEREPGLVVMAARLASQKAPELLLDVVARLLRAGTHPLRGVLAGDGPDRPALLRRAAEKALPVDVPGRVDDVDALLRRADVVVLTSRWEGQPLVLQEALRAGAAIVATDVGGVAEVCGDAAVLVPWPTPGTTPAPVAALADAVGALLADPARAGALRASALRRAGELPTEADALAQLLDVYAVAFARLRRG